MKPDQLAILHIAKSQLKLNDQEYRLILRNLAGVESGKDLDNQSLEKVMAFLEERGFRHKDQPDDYWRKKYAAQSRFCGERISQKIHALAPQVKYPLDSLVAKASKGRTARVEELNPSEANQLVEMLKSMTARENGLNAKAPRHEERKEQTVQHDLFGNPTSPAVFQYAGPLPPPNPDGSYTITATQKKASCGDSISCKPITDDEVPF